jgi:citrate lyase subunit beta/citryl-CoA lyase
VETLNKQAITGNKGDKVRSDCLVSLELTDSGGLQITSNTKVKAVYGESILKLCQDSLSFFGITHCKFVLDDAGALPFVIMARIEAAVKQLMDTDKELLPEILEECKYGTLRERFRFSRLYLPGNAPAMMLNAGIHKPNGIILDLEDSVAPAKKDEARILVRNVLRSIDFMGAERMVRINQGQRGLDDLKAIVPHNLHLILIPKCESAESIKEIEAEIERIKKAHSLTNQVLLMPIIESALGIEKAYEIATSSPNLVALAIGLEDFTADLGVRRTKEGIESLYARMRLVNACHAAKIQPIDSVFSDFADVEGLKENVKISKSLGFEGMGCIHPRQIRVIHETFAPEEEEIEKAKRIVLAFMDAEKLGLGVVALGTKMIDPPVVKRAQKTIHLAVELGLIEKEWYLKPQTI